MQYADIIINHRAAKYPLTYSIPVDLLAYVAIGSVVLVPIGKVKAIGIICAFNRKIDPSISQKLKPIMRVIFEGSFVPSYVMNAAQMMHKKYGYRLSDILFSFLPPFLTKRQKSIVRLPLIQSDGFKVFDYSLPGYLRLRAYEKIIRKYFKKNISLLIITSTHVATQAIAQYFSNLNINTVTFPHPTSPKKLRDYYIAIFQLAQPTVIVGTRGALITPLEQIGAIIVDEPWLPGHKEERAPKLWTAFSAIALCQARKIPVYFGSIIPWPETLMFHPTKRFVVKPSHGALTIMPKNNTAEILTQFLAEYDNANITLAFYFHESPQATLWCPRCKRTVLSVDCPTCSHKVHIFPAFTKASLTNTIKTSNPQANFAVISSAEILQFQSFNAALIIGFDVFLSIIDYRAPNYLLTLINTIRDQASFVQLATSHPDEWTQLLNNGQDYFDNKELAQRKLNHLSPYYLPIRLTTTDYAELSRIKNLLKPYSASINIRAHNNLNVLSAYVRPSINLVDYLSTKRTLNIDILPHYIG